MNLPEITRNIQQQFESLTLESVPTLGLLYAAKARFKDPFNAVQGRDKIEHIFNHMFSQVKAPQFVVTKVIAHSSSEGADVFMRWNFQFERQGQKQSIVGATHFELDAQGLIAAHDDYWDAAEQVYEHIPLLGAVLRWIKRRIHA